MVTESTIEIESFSLLDRFEFGRNHGVRIVRERKTQDRLTKASTGSPIDPAPGDPPRWT